MKPTKSLPDYVKPYDGQTQTRADGSVWRSHVSDCGTHFAVIWNLIAYPWQGKLVEVSP